MRSRLPGRSGATVTRRTEGSSSQTSMSESLGRGDDGGIVGAFLFERQKGALQMETQRLRAGRIGSRVEGRKNGWIGLRPRRDHGWQPGGDTGDRQLRSEMAE